jgi:hypothetical protein
MLSKATSGKIENAIDNIRDAFFKGGQGFREDVDKRG